MTFKYRGLGRIFLNSYIRHLFTSGVPTLSLRHFLSSSTPQNNIRWLAFQIQKTNMPLLINRYYFNCLYDHIRKFTSKEFKCFHSFNYIMSLQILNIENHILSLLKKTKLWETGVLKQLHGMHTGWPLSLFFKVSLVAPKSLKMLISFAIFTFPATKLIRILSNCSLLEHLPTWCVHRVLKYSIY